MNIATISFDASIKKFVAKLGDTVIAKGNFRAYVAAVIELNLSKKAKKLAVTSVEHIDIDKDPVQMTKRVAKVIAEPVLFTVLRKKDNAVVAAGITKEVAEQMIAKAKSAKKAALIIA